MPRTWRRTASIVAPFLVASLIALGILAWRSSVVGPVSRTSRPGWVIRRRTRTCRSVACKGTARRGEMTGIVTRAAGVVKPVLHAGAGSIDLRLANDTPDGPTTYFVIERD